MNSLGRPAFWEAYAKLAPDVKRRARKAYALWRNDRRHPGLEFKRVSDTHAVYSIRVDGHRALCLLDGNTVTWLWIGKHDDYMRLLKQWA